MNAVIKDLSTREPGITPTLGGTLLRNVIAQYGIGGKINALLNGFTRPITPSRSSVSGIDMFPGVEYIDTPIRHVITRPHDGFSVEFVADTIKGSNGILAFKGTFTKEELIAIQQAGYKVSITSQSWRESSYVSITE